MNVEQLLQTLRDGGLDDEAIKNLLSEALASLEPAPEQEQEPADENAEQEEAGKLLGVNL